MVDLGRSPGTSLAVAPGDNTGVGRVMLRLPVPSQSEGDGLASDLTHAQMFSGGDPERVAASLCLTDCLLGALLAWIHRGLGNPDYRVASGPNAGSRTPSDFGT